MKWTGLARGGTAPLCLPVLGLQRIELDDWASLESIIDLDVGAAGRWDLSVPTLWVRNAGSINPYDTFIAAGPAAIGPPAALSPSHEFLPIP